VQLYLVLHDARFVCSFRTFEAAEKYVTQIASGQFLDTFTHVNADGIDIYAWVTRLGRKDMIYHIIPILHDHITFSFAGEINLRIPFTE
jgi:hypothetical protein